MVHGWRALAGGAALVVALGGAASATAFAADGDEPRLTAPLLQDADCSAPEAAPATEPAAATAGQTVVSFTVPSITRLRSDAGAVVAAATNSGCAPRPGDVFAVGDRAATPAEIAEALATFTGGDWTTPGVWHPAR